MLDSVSDDHCCVPEIERVFAALSLPVRPTSATTRAEALTFGALETFNAVAGVEKSSSAAIFLLPNEAEQMAPTNFFFLSFWRYVYFLSSLLSLARERMIKPFLAQGPESVHRRCRSFPRFKASTNGTGETRGKRATGESGPSANRLLQRRHPRPSGTSLIE